ncbi:MAG: DUF2288 family protein [Myxococcota bacterium]
MQPTELQTRLESELMDVEFDAIIPHVEREAVVWVSPEIPLVMAAMAVSLDATAEVQRWLTEGQLKKLTREQTQDWAKTERFSFLIVQPFVLIQPAPAAQADPAESPPGGR